MNNNSIFATIALLVLVVAMGATAWLVPTGYNFLTLVALLTVFFLTLGILVVGKPLGVFVNERHLMSLSRFQMVVWTIVVLAGYVALVVHRMQGRMENALAVPMDPQLWMLMGISATSLVGSPFVLSTKRDKEPSKAVVDRAKAESAEPELAEIRQGTLYANAKAEDASIKDLFQGDEIGNTTRVDLAKTQMFVFTLIFAVSYAADLFQKLSADVIIDQFPPLSNGVVTLLGISHAGYLVGKTVDHTPSK